MVRFVGAVLVVVSVGCAAPTYKGFLEGEVNGSRVSFPDADIIAGVAAWPADAAQDQVYANMAFFQPGRQEVALSGAASGVATMTVERVRWTGDGNFPFVHQGRMQGATIDARFEISEPNCKVADVFDDYACDRGHLAEASFDEGVTFGDRTGVSDCPAEIEEKYLGDGAMTVTADRLTWGDVAIDCVRTDKMEIYLDHDENTVFGHVCGADDAITVDGCSWRMVAVGSPAGDYVLTAGIVDEDCEARMCSIRALPASGG